ncbi:MAG TPA: hypothetical protein VJL90_15855 [Pseudorhodoplanes sp.]|nr:hypothetical protein [Pseudorhodoplanes sp.]
MTTAQMSAKRPIGVVECVGYLALVSICATALAALAGFLFVIAIGGFPLLFLAVGYFPLGLRWLWNGALLAVPVTVLLLPATVVVGRSHPVALCFALPIVGLIGGVIAMNVWPSAYASAPELFQYAKTYLLFDRPPTEWPFLVAGAVAGLVAGIFFSRAVRKMHRYVSNP